MLPCFTAADTDARPLWTVPAGHYQAWLARQGAHIKAWLEGSGFEAKPGACALLPGQDGAPAGALVVLSEPAEPWDVAAAHARLPEGDWRLAPAEADLDASQAALGWALASYRFDRYRKRDTRPRRLAVDEDAAGRAAIVAEAVWLARDLINTPAADLGPAELAEAVAGRREAVRRDLPDHGRRRSAAGGLSGDLRGRPGEPARAARGRPRLGRCERAARHPGRQGRVLRYRRARPQELGRHAADEEGHGRRRGDARARPGDHGGEAAGPPAAPDRRGREQRRRQRLPPGRRAAHAQGPDRRDRQHRCRRPPGAVRPARRGRPREAGPADRLRDLDRRRPRGARPRPAGAVHARRSSSPPTCWRPVPRRSIRSGACPCITAIAS